MNGMGAAVLVGLLLMVIPLYPWPYFDERTSLIQQAMLRCTMLGVGAGWLFALLATSIVLK